MRELHESKMRSETNFDFAQQDRPNLMINAIRDLVDVFEERERVWDRGHGIDYELEADEIEDDDEDSVPLFDGDYA